MRNLTTEELQLVSGGRKPGGDIIVSGSNDIINPHSPDEA
jgi:bacteriocin-like protein